jgi:AcrR family transcriptional regulator
MASTPHKVRRPGYAPVANVGVGRRGLHTRDRILASAAEVFLANGFHSASLDTIAKAANASRATVYQYFAGKDEIFNELSAVALRDILDHGARLNDLGPTIDGLGALHHWLVEWADIYSTHEAVFAEFPGIGSTAGFPMIDAGSTVEKFSRSLTDRLRGIDLRGLDPAEAAAVLMRIPHMVHLYRRRAMFPLPATAVVSWSLTVALQLMLFPDTPPDVLLGVAPQDVDQGGSPALVSAERPEPTPEVVETPRSPIVEDVLSASSALFAEYGYYAVGMEEIAAAADLSRATLYRYFSTKDRILAELTLRAVSEIEEHAAALPRMGAGALTEWMVSYVGFHRAYRGVIRAWFDGTVAERLSDNVFHGMGAIHRAVSVWLDTVELPNGLDAEVASAVFLAVLGRMTEPTATGAPVSDEEAAQLMVNLVRRSLLRTV